MYTGALARHLRTPGLDIKEVFDRTAQEVERVTQGRQRPREDVGLRGRFVLRAAGAAAVAAVAPVPSVAPAAPQGQAQAAPALSAAEVENQFWADAKAINNREAYEAYLAEYPTGRYAALARAAIGRLQAAGAAGVASAGGAGAAGGAGTTAQAAPPVQAVPPAQAPARPPPPAPARTGLGPPGSVFKDCDDCPEMVVIPGGSFLMGSPPGEGSDTERPQRRVQVGAFAMGRFEVTQRQWFAVMGTRPSYFSGDDRPVEQVTWQDAQTFVSRLSQRTGKRYRLPSEAEWEYAARAGSTTAYPFGSDASRLSAFAWFSSNSGGGTQAVGRLQPNAFGLYDMLGNVWEWTEDCWTGSYAGAPTDGRAWTAGDCGRRVLRGGSWFFIPRFVRAAFRDRDTSANRSSDFGFRVARTD